VAVDNSRLFLFAALVFVGMLMWQQWQADYGPRPTAEQQAGQSGESPRPRSASEGDDLPVPAETVGSIATPSAGEAVTAVADEGRMLQVDTDVIRALIDTRGGVLRSLKLKNYPTSLEQPNDWLELVHDRSDTVYIVQSGLLNKEELAPTHSSLYEAAQTEFALADGANELRVPLRWEKDGIEVIKTYRFTRGDYLIDVLHQVTNNTDADWAGSQYRQLRRSRPLETSRLLYTYTGSVYYNEAEKYEKIDFDAIEDGQFSASNLRSRDNPDSRDEIKQFEGGWIAMIQHYFLTAWIPGADDTNTLYTIARTAASPPTYTIGLRSQNLLVRGGESGELSSSLFVGPKLTQRLEEISPGLELTVDYGWLTFLSKPLYWLLSWYHDFVDNWGVAIILLTLTVKGAFYKLSETSYKSMAKMRKVSPRLKTLKERYGDDRQKMNQEMMKLYKEEKINPMGGCLPILVQIPVFIALYWALLESVELRQAPFILWIEDLSVMDPYFVLPILMGISMVIQQKLNPPPPDPIQAKVMMALPFVFTVFFAFFPAGLVLYWVVNNVLSIAQQWVITKRIEAAK
jgi:YidC/Oxa1 family membrane protein insertase